MGIHNLAKLIADFAPSAMKEQEMKSYFGRKIAIDASMCIYQFLIAVRSDGAQLANEDGEVTSHLVGLFYRTIRMVDNGIKPAGTKLWVQGVIPKIFHITFLQIRVRRKPPDLNWRIVKRKERRQEAEKELEKAKEAGDTENVQKFERRLVRATPQHNEDCKKLLKLMGIPYVEAPGEAEAQCVALVNGDKVYGVGTEDMDALTFGTKVMLRHLTASEAKKLPVQEYSFNKVLEGLNLSHEEVCRNPLRVQSNMLDFIDLCILMGCDYCGTIRGIGPKRAIELIQKYKNIEAVLENIDQKKYPPPEGWLFKQARELFKHPDVTPAEDIELKWTDPDEEGVVDFMCKRFGFNEERIRNGCQKLKKGRKGSTQGRLDSFFTVVANKSSNKRKAEEMNGKKSKKAKGSFKKRK
ncbi:putative flap endonuclease 1-like [Apostichopus japonicus]|uniref:Flap endonuclease 1 n=1 Tax=Stichopus japonicus TaxID=307972 RepID=A0A2G8L337_STIJA|nr:putative flap endonuclease 1-like [Apostichopus japonicus]